MEEGGEEGSFSARRCPSQDEIWGESSEVLASKCVGDSYKPLWLVFSFLSATRKTTTDVNFRLGTRTCICICACMYMYVHVYT